MEEQTNCSVKCGRHELLRRKSEQKLKDEDLKEVNNSKWEKGKGHFRQKRLLTPKAIREWLEPRKQTRRVVKEKLVYDVTGSRLDRVL